MKRICRIKCELKKGLVQEKERVGVRMPQKKNEWEKGKIGESMRRRNDELKKGSVEERMI